MSEAPLCTVAPTYAVQAELMCSNYKSAFLRHGFDFFDDWNYEPQQESDIKYCHKAAYHALRWPADLRR